MFGSDINEKSKQGGENAVIQLQNDAAYLAAEISRGAFWLLAAFLSLSCLICTFQKLLIDILVYIKKLCRIYIT